MSLNELSAQELARIDAVSMEFEAWLGRQLASRSDRLSPDPTAAETLDVQPQIDTLVDQFTADTRSDDHPRLVAALRHELEAVASELLRASTLSSSPGSHAPTTEIEPSSAIHEFNKAANQTNPDFLQPGLQLGPYLIDGLIGRGGMGEVYRGRDLRLGREVAIKILIHAWSNTPEHSERFDRESRAVAALSHPSIVSLYDVGHHAGRPYAVMELLKGETLRERLRSAAPLPPDEVRRLGAAAANALEVAHQAGIVHRDLKPENLFLTNDSRVKLLDFGLSRSYNDKAGSGDPTQTGIILGTMGYLSPEQAAGKRITTAADLFSLGCVLHECFYGFRPFAGETTNEILAATINGEPRTDPQIAATDPQLAGLINLCLAKEPEGRPASAGVLAAQLEDYSSRIIAIEQPPTPSGASRFNRSPREEKVAIAGPQSLLSNHDVARISNGELAGDDAASSAIKINRRSLLQGIGLTAASIAGASVLYGGFRWIYPRSDIRSIAVLPLDNAGPRPGTVEGLELRELHEGEEIAAAISDQLTRIPDLRVVPFLPLRESNEPTGVRNPSEAFRSPEAVRKLCNELGVDALLMGSFDIDEDGFRTIKVTLIEGLKGSQIGRYTIRARREENLIAQQETAEKVAQGIGRELLAYRSGRTHENSTYHCLVNGYSRMDSESVEALRDAIKCFKHAIDQDEKFAEAYSGLALTSMILASQVNFEERTNLISDARDALRFAMELGDDTGQPRIAESMLAWQIDWDFEKADRLFRQYVPQMPDSWVAQHEYAYFLAAQGDLSGAIRHAERAVGIDPTSTAFRITAARLRWFSGNWQAALSEMRATAAKATGKRLELVRGATLDLLEAVGKWEEANALLLGTSSSFSHDKYWQAREATLKQRPYGPYDDELNLLILRVRRGDQIDDQMLNEIKLHRPPRLPFLLAVHPTLTTLRNAEAFAGTTMV